MVQFLSPQDETQQHSSLLRFSCVRDPVARFVSAVNFLTVMDRSLQYLRKPLPLRSNPHANPNANGKNSAEDQFLNGSAIAGVVASRLLEDGFFNWHLWPQSVYLSR